MNSYDQLPDAKIEPKGMISEKFLALQVYSFKDACMYVHHMDYGYNTDYEDPLILFKEGQGTCTSKHGVIATLAVELDIPLVKNVGIYKFTEAISTGAQTILDEFHIPYVPMVHCFLMYQNLKFDLTEGNNNGKKTSIEHFIHTAKVDPFISRKDEYLLFRKVLKETIINFEEMQGITQKSLVKARIQALGLLKVNMTK